MRKLFFFVVFVFSVMQLVAQVPAPQKNGHYELKKKKLVIESGECTNGYKTGTWFYYNDFGKKTREEDFDGNGFLLRTRQYTRTSVFTEQFTFVNGVYSGPYKLFSESTSFISIEGNYKNGQRDSVWNYYRVINNKTDKWKTEMWDEGKRREINTFYPGGKIFKTELLNEFDTVAAMNYFDMEGMKINTRNWISKKDSLVSDSILKNAGGPLSDSAKKIVFGEVMPRFYGGGTVNSFLGQNVHYPLEAMEDARQGTVYISFIVNKWGDVENVVVARSSGNKYLDAEAVRVTEMMPPWVPASLGARFIRIEMKIPVKFILE